MSSISFDPGPMDFSKLIKQDEHEAMRNRSGRIKFKSRLVSFIYELLRDDLPSGRVEYLVKNSKEGDCLYTNGWLALYAKDIADRLLSKSEINSKLIENYSFLVTYSEDDGEFIGKCLEFPSLSYLDLDKDEAFKGIQELVLSCCVDAERRKENLPDPVANESVDIIDIAEEIVRRASDVE